MTKLSYEAWKRSKHSIPDIVLEMIEKEEGEKAVETLLRRHYQYYLDEEET